MDFDDLYDKLPLASQPFTEIRDMGLVYVDKTEFVYRIARNPVPKIFSRPRRFGKSTIAYTLEELFLHGVAPYDGHDSYFKGLAIEKLWHDEGEYLVLRFDFHEINSDCAKVEDFEALLIKQFVEVCRDHDLTLPKEPFRFRELFSSMLKQLPQRSVVLLIDEYDAPLLRHVNDKAELEKCRLLMIGLFGAIKSNQGKFRCVFFTGITRYQDLEFGTAANTFTDLTNHPKFAASCGYTRAELKQYFADNLRYAAAVRAGCDPEAVSSAQIEALLDEMSFWYDGYSFDGSQQNKVFSTWSVLQFFADYRAIFDSYWSSEESQGLPQLLKVTLARVDLTQLLNEVAAGEIVVSSTEFRRSSLLNPEANPYALMFQAGYLTLSQPISRSGKIHLQCPNNEIRLAFANLVAWSLFNKDDFYSPDYVQRSLGILSRHDPKEMLAHFRDLFASVSYDRYAITSESTVAALISFHLFSLGLKPRMEVVNNAGKADCVFDLPKHELTIVFEYKFVQAATERGLNSTLNAAIKQVLTRKYAHDAASQRIVASFALVFSAAKTKRNIERLALADYTVRYEK